MPRWTLEQYEAYQLKRKAAQTTTPPRSAPWGPLELEKLQAAPSQPKRGSWDAGWRVVGGQRFFARSRWEANYGRFLQWRKERGEILSWSHEPKCFWFESIKRGTRSYLPDFGVMNLNGVTEYHEVKGWMDPKSKTKIKRFRKYYPNEVLIVRDSAWFKANQNLRLLIKDWETSTLPPSKLPKEPKLP